jgi:riboflavin kinase/FMN adenylyltransferase
MQVHTQLSQLPNFRNPVITIGTFDGVHQGHRRIIERIKTLAEECEGESVVITFEPHPRLLLNPDDQSLTLIHTIPEKTEVLSALNVDHLVVVPFTLEFARQTAEAYVEDFLIGHFHPHTIVIGYDHQFGAERSGNYQLLERYQKDGRFQLEEIPVQMILDLKISSTQIRQAIQAGKIAEANTLLGTPYSLIGQVIHGKGRGKGIGYPTANIQVEHPRKLIPQQGVYAVWVETEFGKQAGMMNIGTNPTFESGPQIHLEVHLLDWQGDLYDKTIRIIFIERIRPEYAFDSVDALIQQIKSDEKHTRVLFGI